MGLDIYLYPAADAAANALRNEALNAFYERPDYDDLTEAQREEIRAAIPAYVSQQDVPSERYPDHLFNRRYLRSSYNGAGFNRAVPDLTGTEHGLDWIFEPMGREWDGDEGRLDDTDVPKLRECRKRAEQVAEELRECDPLRVISEGLMLGDRDHMWSTPPSEAQVLAWYRAQKVTHASPEARARPHWSDGGYSTAKGLVLGFDKGAEALALVVGQDFIGRPAAIVVYRLDADALASYVQSAEITAEFIDEAIALIERDGSACMSWSG